MTTALLEMLKHDDFDYKKWLKEKLIRSFGICVGLRDDSYKLTEQEIFDKLMQIDAEHIKYLNERKQRYLAEIVRAQANLGDGIRVRAYEEYDRIQENAKIRIAKAEQEAKEYELIKEKQKKLLEQIKCSDNSLVQAIYDMLEKQFMYQYEDIQKGLKYAKQEQLSMTRDEYYTEYINQQKMQIQYSTSALADIEKEIANYECKADIYASYCKAIDALDI